MPEEEVSTSIGILYSSSFGITASVSVELQAPIITGTLSRTISFSAVATASAFGIVISIPAAIGFVYAGWGNPMLPPYSLGYVNLLGCLLIVPTSMIATPWGVHLAHAIPPLALKRAFAVFLGITAVRMILSLVA